MVIYMQMLDSKTILILYIYLILPDTGQKILELCQRNIERNVTEIECAGDVKVRDLNWLHPFSDCRKLLCLCVTVCLVT